MVFFLIDDIKFLEEDDIWDKISATDEYGFSLDKAGKKLIRKTSPDKLIPIINELCGTNFPKGCTLTYLTTEHQDVTGDNKLLLGDLVIQINPPKDYKSPKTNILGVPMNWKTLERSWVISLEVQSTKNSKQEEIGYRLFMYSLNNIEKRYFKLKKKKKLLYVIPKGATIYTIAGMPKSGIDEVYVQYDKFRVRKHKFSAQKGDVLVLEFPYINLFGMDVNELDQSVYNLFLTIYLYKFRQKPKLMLKKEFEEALILIEKGLSRFKGDEEEYDTLLEIYRDLHRDLKIAIKRQDLRDDNPNNDYRKAMKVMQQTELTYGERAVKEFREKVAHEAVRLLKIEMEEKQQMQQEKYEQQMKQMQEEQMQQIQQMQNDKKSIARNLLSCMNDNEISVATGLGIEEVALLRKEKK